MKRELAIGVFALFCGARSASATPVQWIFTGAVDQRDEALTSVNIGDTYTLTVVMESETEPTPIDPYNPSAPRIYATGGFTVSIEESYFSTYSGTAANIVQVSGAVITKLHLSVGEGLGPLDGAPFLGGSLFDTVFFYWDQPLPDTLAFPVPPRFQLAFGEGGEISLLGGEITSAVVVPEPSLSIPTAGIATGIVACRRRRLIRRRTRAAGAATINDSTVCSMG